MIAAAVVVVIVVSVASWMLGVRFGFTRGMRARLAGAIPSHIASSRRGTKAFGRAFAGAARREHKAELARLKTLSKQPKWRQRLDRWLFP